MIKTDVNSFAIGLSCALLLHAVGLIAMNSVRMKPVEVYQSIIVHMDNSDIPVKVDAAQLGIESAGSSDSKKDQAADKKRRIFETYQEDISDCIHAHRFLLPGSSGLIGLVYISIQINAEGEFTAVRLRKTSGNPQLDKAAVMAAQACSGKVKRPQAIGTHNLTVLHEVRCQYKL